MTTLGTRVKQRRKELKLSQEQLATLAGLQQGDISKIETGRITRTTAIVELARALQCSVDTLYDGQEATTHHVSDNTASYIAVTPVMAVEALVRIMRTMPSTDIDRAAYLLERLARDPAGPWSGWLMDIMQANTAQFVTKSISDHGELSAAAQTAATQSNTDAQPPGKRKPVFVAASNTQRANPDTSHFNLGIDGGAPGTSAKNERHHPKRVPK